MTEEIEDPAPEAIALRRFDLHSLWRVLLWGASAAMAVAVVAGTAFSDIGTDRLKQAIASVIEPAKVEPQQPQLSSQQLADLEMQTRKLAQTVRDLTAERDQFKGRLAALEQNLEDVTGTVKRQAAQSAAPKLLPALPKEVAQNPPPVLTAPPTAAATASPTTPAPAPDAPATTATIGPVTEPALPVAGPVPLPPSRLASAAQTATSTTETASPAVATTREIGVDLGGAASIDALRAHWAALKANVGPDLVGFSAALYTRQKQSGATDYRLVVGPMPNSATAIRLCAKLVASRLYCRAGTFTVQQLAER